jgi:micrococcal nuclease
VTRVVDGDTVDVAGHGGTPQRVRLLGIDAPETAHDGAAAACGADEAAAGLRRLLPVGTTVTVTPDPAPGATDKYGRTLAYMAAPDTPDVALALLRAGLVEAWTPAGEPRPARWASYTAAQLAAQTRHTGSWAVCDILGR